MPWSIEFRVLSFEFREPGLRSRCQPEPLFFFGAGLAADFPRAVPVVFRAVVFFLAAGFGAVAAFFGTVFCLGAGAFTVSAALAFVPAVGLPGAGVTLMLLIRRTV